MYKATVKITAYKNYLILTLLNKGPKIRSIGVGTQFVGFHDKDLLISSEALNILREKALNEKRDDPALEIISKFNIFWKSDAGIIIPNDEAINVYALPNHTICDNDIDEKVKQAIDQ